MQFGHVHIWAEANRDSLMLKSKESGSVAPEIAAHAPVQ